MPDETQWLVVFQSSVSPRKPVGQIGSNWKRFRILRVEDIDAGV